MRPAHHHDRTTANPPTQMMLLISYTGKRLLVLIFPVMLTRPQGTQGQYAKELGFKAKTKVKKFGLKAKGKAEA